MREKFILATFGLILGAVLFFVSKPLIVSALNKIPEGAEFESVEDFQRAMLKRDQRDVQADDSVSLRSIITPHPSDKIIYDLLPNLAVKFQGVPVRTNSCGMRGEEVAIEKPADVFRIAFLGDSFTFGWGVEEQEAFPSVTASILNDLFGDTLSVESLNFGVPGYSTFQQVALFEEKGVDFEPDVVVVFLIDNDFGLPFFIKNVHQSGEVVTGTSFAKSAWAGEDQKVLEHQEYLNKLLNVNAWLQRLGKLGKKRGFQTFLAINPRPGWKSDLSRVPIAKKGRLVSLVPMRKQILKMIENRKIEPKALSLPHDPHPSPIKHQLLGELIAASLYPTVAQHYDEVKSYE